VLSVKLDTVKALELKAVLLLDSVVEAVADVAAVEQAPVDLPALLDQMVCPVKMELLDKLVITAKMDPLLLPNLNAIGASIAPQDLQVVLVMLAERDLPAELDNPAVLPMADVVDPLAQLDLLDPVVNLDTPDKLETMAPPVPYGTFPAQWDHLAQLVHLDNPVNLEELVAMDILAPLDNLDNLEMLVQLVPPANLAPMEIMAQMEKLDPAENALIVLPHVPHPVIKDENYGLYYSLLESLHISPCPHFFLLFVLPSFNIKNERYK